MASRRFDMPALFGPSLIPDRTIVPFAEVVSISFETTTQAAARLMPRFFTPADPPIVTISRIDYREVDYLGGRGYGEIVVTVGALHPADPRPAGFAPVMWVTEPAALIAGREYMGFAKLPATMDAIDHSSDGRGFAAREYEAGLIEGRVTGLRPLSTEALDKINRTASEVRTYGWKLIPGDGPEPDVDHPLVNVMRWHYDRAWSGDGELSFYRPSPAEAPMSARVVAALADLPIVAQRRAFVAEGRAEIDRSATRRLTETL
ncbi:acetoacetate decarboxylase family protein [Rhizorhabdus histidinilytica]|uniref:acetoacetate decarboxylase family protein n=1 Tax=Rhizorhabdus histidinilytica TaxID=439228 RepID=UPI00321F9668